MTLEETPKERLERLMKDRKKRAEGQTTPKQGDKPAASEEEMAKGVPPEVRAIIERIVGAVGEDVDVEIKDVTPDDAPEGLRIGEVRISQDLSQDKASMGDSLNTLGVHMDLGVLDNINDERIRDHALGVVEASRGAVAQLAASGDDSALVQFAMGMGLIVARAGMSGAMVLSGKAGKAGIDAEDFTTAMSGSIGGMILAAVRYGQSHPDALTAADGISAADLAGAVDQFLASLGKDDNNENDNKEEDEE